MEKLGVIAGDSRDKEGQHRMLPLSPMAHFDVTNGNKSALPSWFKSYIYYPYKKVSFQSDLLKKRIRTTNAAAII